MSLKKRKSDVAWVRHNKIRLLLCEEDFETTRHAKILKFKGTWNDLFAEVCFCWQLRINNLALTKENEQSLTVPENFDTSFEWFITIIAWI